MIAIKTPEEKRANKLAYYVRYNSNRKEKALAYRIANHAKRTTMARERRSKDKEKWRQHWRDYRAKHKDKFKAYEKKRWVEKKADYQRARMADPEVRKKRNDWSKKNRELKPELEVAKAHKRRALMLNAATNLDGIKAFVKSVKTKPKFVCYYCQKTFPVSACHFDHIVPLCKGGAHSVENLCASCQHCNNTKYTRSFGVWIKTGQQILNL